MNHWQRFQRVYVGLTIFVSVNAGAAVVVFGSLSDQQLAALSGRGFVLDCIKCIALASANLLTYLSAPAKPVQPPAPPVA